MYPHSEFPYSSRVIKNSQGEVTEVVLSYNQYLQLLEELEDAGLYRAMMQVRNEKPISKEEALQMLNQE